MNATRTHEYLRWLKEKGLVEENNGQYKATMEGLTFAEVILQVEMMLV
jgi:predicted transcriptional regulator